MPKINPRDRRYSPEHEWALDTGEGQATIGITDHAQSLLTDVVFVELPEIGRVVKAMDPLAVVESVKSVSDVYSPVSGEVVEVNGKLETEPELINQDAFGKGWIAKLRMVDRTELDGLMDAVAYEKMIDDEAHE